MGEIRCDICGRDNITEKELSIHIKFFHKKASSIAHQPQQLSSGICPECGSTLWFQEGCVSCRACGFSRCG